MIAGRLGTLAVDIGERPLPDEVLHAAKRCFLDSLAAMICGASHPPASLMVDALEEELDHGRAKIIPSGRRAPIRTAALINGTSAQAMEVDDIFREAVYHPGPPVLASALAASQSFECTGDVLLRSLIAGYEVSNRVGKEMQPTHYDYWHTTGTIGTIGAAAGCAVAIKLTSVQAKHALANSVTMAAALQQSFASDAMGKPIHAGHAAEAGALAALIARGLGNAMSQDVDWEAVTANLNDVYTITRMTQKNYTCCGHVFAPIDSIIALASEHNLTVEDIASINVRTYAKSVEICGNRDPKTVYEAKFSLPYALAVGLIFRRARFNEFNHETLYDLDVRKLMSLVDFEVDADAEKRFPNSRSATVTVKTLDGRHLKHHSPTRKGDPDNPLSDSELEDKFYELVEPVIGSVVADALLTACWNLEKINNINNLPYTTSELPN